VCLCLPHNPVLIECTITEVHRCADVSAPEGKGDLVDINEKHLLDGCLVIVSLCVNYV
jgi:hypothetical protein